MPTKTRQFGVEFPEDNHERKYTIDGVKVDAKTLTQSEGGRETVSAVIVRAANADVLDKIRRAIGSKSIFAQSTTNPLTGVESSVTLYITARKGLLSASGILERIDRELEFLQSQSRLLHRVAQSQPAKTPKNLKADLIKNEDPVVTRLLRATYDAIEHTYGIEKIGQEKMAEFMHEVSVTITTMNIPERMTVTQTAVSLPSGKEIRLSVGAQAKKAMESSEILPTVLKAFGHHFHIPDSDTGKKAYAKFKGRLGTELKDAASDILFPRQGGREGHAR